VTIRYTPGSASVPEPLVATPDFPGAVVLLLAGAQERDWAARTAVDLASAWAGSGRRVVLADLHLEDPFLHETVGEENLEGVVDVFLYGASLARSARPLRGHGFHLVTAGTYTDDADAVHRHPRWSKLIEGFRGAQASFVLFAPAESEVARELGRHATDALLLAAAEEVADALPDGVRRHPPLAPPAPAAASDEAGDEAAPAAAPPAEVRNDPGDVELPPPPPRRRRIRGGVSPFVWVVIILAALVFAALLVASERPEIFDPLRERLSGLGGEVTQPLAVPASRRAVATGDTLAYSVQLKAYNSLRAARQQLAVEQRRHRDVPLVISPELVSDILYYKLYAGMTPDTSEAVRLRQRLVAAGSLDENDALGSWPLIHDTSLTFLLREEREREVALARADSLTERGVPAYAVRLPYTDGSSRWRVYGGSFGDTLRAEGMRRLLEDAGLTAELVVRLGAREEER
jgi:hypothetical protein